MNAVATPPLTIAPKTAASEMWLLRSSTPAGSSTGRSEKSSISPAEKPSAVSAETASVTDLVVRNSAVSNILILPNCDHRKNLHENQIEQRHCRKCGYGYRDLNPSRCIGAPNGCQARPPQRVHDNQKA